MKKGQERKRINKDDYIIFQNQLKTLVDNTPKLKLNSTEHNINSIPDEANIYFIDSKYMDNFSELSEHDIRTCKLINYGKPAITLSFSSKHKYYLSKNIDSSDEEIQKSLSKTIKNASGKLLKHSSQLQLDIELLKKQFKQNNINDDKELISLTIKEAKKSIAENEEQINKYMEMVLNISSYKFVVSNYYKDYIYTYVSYSYEVDGVKKTSNTHIVTDSPKVGSVKEKSNVIFVDVDKIAKKISYQNKEIEIYLSQFPEKISLNSMDVFYKKID